jgi:hypothetical protein
MHYPDMSEQCIGGRGQEVRAIGWLERGHPFLRGRVPRAFRKALRQHVAHAWQPIVYRGAHRCTLCPIVVRTFAGRGHLNVWIPSEKHLFIAPAMILHYIGWHRYRPPEPFVEAVLACPPQGSEAFFERMRAFRECLPLCRFPGEEEEPW